MDLDLLPEGWRPWIPTVAVPLGAIALALLVELIGLRVLTRLARQTTGTLDDRLVDALRRPLALTIALAGLWFGMRALHPPEAANYLAEGVIVSLEALLWTLAFLKIAAAVLDAFDGDGRGVVVQPATRPLFDLLARVLVIGVGIYFLFIAWDIDVTAWLASAGIVGIAVGFAAQDTLANLFAGFSILVDRPYKLGDYLIIESAARGRVTMIGMRSTRLLTRDDVEVIIPNAQMASARIVNESGGPFERKRVSAIVGVSYDSDMTQVREVLLRCAAACADIVRDDPMVTPRVRFREFGASSLVVHLLVWIPRPELRGRVIDELNTRILVAFREAGIDMPFPVQTVRLEPVDDPS